MRFKALSLGLAAVLAVSCTDQITNPTALNDGAVAPAFDIGNAPDASGIVMRDGTPYGSGWSDFKNGMQVTIGFDPTELCVGVFDFDFVPFQQVNLPGGRLLQLIQGDDLRTAVWPFTAFDCDLFTTVAPLATGVSDVVETDNDLIGSGPGDKNANSYGVRAHGILTRPSGASARFSGHVNITFNQQVGDKVSSKISLH